MTRSRRLRTAGTASALLLAAVALTGCSGGTVSMKAAPDANSPLCADVTVRLPQSVDGQQRRWTDAQATGAWGDPAAVLLTCGVAEPGPSTLRCITVGGIDWLVDESESPHYRLTTYGRNPAVEVYVDNEVVSPNNVLDDVRLAVAQLPKDADCTAPEAPLDEQDSGTG
ncbi:DUF3515 family protein [Microbacterium sp. B2969]|uniref:DUF3515 family protein n=1 Tax=Microbacterium alkaliflavum TaxID=3248839 RepID=A0ABW7Q6M0_9MICO